MAIFANPIQCILGIILILSALGIIIARKPVHASLSFLLTLLSLAALYLQYSADFIAVMQILIYAGAILVIFIFVIILFQDAYQHIDLVHPQSAPLFLFIAGTAFVVALVFLGQRFLGIQPVDKQLPEDFGTVQALGHALYIDFFFPFEAVTLLFLVAIIGAFYIGKKEA